MIRGSSADVVVVGGGLVGACAAYELAGTGARVTVVDGSLPGRASDAGAGILSPETFHDPDRAWFEFGADAARHLHSLVARLADDGADPGPSAFARCGSLVVALAEHEDPWFSEVRRQAEERGVTEIPAEEARGMFPPLAPLWRALYNPAAARVDGRRLSAAVRSAARRRGVAFVPLEVVGVERRGALVTAVRGERAVVRGDAFVLAAGAWSATVAAWLGETLPVAPVKGEIVHVVLGPGTDRHGTGPGGADSGRWPIVQPVLNFYLVPWPGGRVACGGTFEPGAGFDARPTTAGVRDLVRECLTIAPGLGAATFSEVRVGLRPGSEDDRPLLGRLPGVTNVHVCTGHGANGLLMGPYSAALVARQVVDGSGGPLPYDVSRAVGA